MYDPATGTWSYTGSLNKARAGHTATLLPNGKVLIAGGDSGDYSPTNAAELYDPVTGTWSFTGNLNEGRFHNTATLLANGKVLVAGGAGDIEYLSIQVSAELYDPETETWNYTGRLKANRVDHAAVLLANGDVLLAGFGPYNELYSGSTGMWRKTGGNNSRIYHTLTVLPNGKALMAGGANWGTVVDGSEHALSDAGIYNPASGIWKKTAELNAPRAFHTATLLSDGKVLVVGGFDARSGSGVLVRSAELYDPEVLDPAPRIIMASVTGKKLFITGENFDDGAVILLNGEEQKSKNDGQNPQTILIGKKAGKKIKAGDRIQVRNSDGTVSEGFIFAGF